MSVRWILCVMLAGAVAHVPAMALASSAPAEDRPRVSLEIDVSALPSDEDTQELQTWLLEHQSKVLRDGGVDVVPSADTTIRVSVARYGEGDVNYRAAIAMIDHRRGGDDEVVEQREITCEACRDSDLAARIGEEVARLSGRILYAPGDAEEAVDPSGESTAQEPSTPPAVVRPIGPLGFGGIASLAVGIGATVAGGVLAVKPADARPVSNGAEVRRYRPTGIALASVGSAVALAGAAMIAGDVLRRRNERKLTLLPTVGPGVALHVRF